MLGRERCAPKFSRHPAAQQYEFVLIRQGNRTFYNVNDLNRKNPALLLRALVLFLRQFCRVGRAKC